jgi:hypothetical protein
MLKGQKKEWASACILFLRRSSRSVWFFASSFFAEINGSATGTGNNSFSV